MSAYRIYNADPESLIATEEYMDGMIKAAVEAEREACAKEAENYSHIEEGYDGNEEYVGYPQATAENIAKAIRARGEPYEHPVGARREWGKP